VQVGLPDFTQKEREHLGQELSDVLLYLIRLADRCHIDLPKVAEEKIKLNAIKYPAKLVLGSSKKYNEYAQEQTSQQVIHANHINGVQNKNIEIDASLNNEIENNSSKEYYWVVSNTEVNVNINGTTSSGIIKSIKLDEIIRCTVYLRDIHETVSTTADKLIRVKPGKKDKIIVVDIESKYRGQTGTIISFDKQYQEICSVRLDINSYEIKEMHLDHLAKYKDKITQSKYEHARVTLL